MFFFTFLWLSVAPCSLRPTEHSHSQTFSLSLSPALGEAETRWSEGCACYWHLGMSLGMCVQLPLPACPQPLLLARCLLEFLAVMQRSTVITFQT